MFALTYAMISAGDADRETFSANVRKGEDNENQPS